MRRAKTVVAVLGVCKPTTRHRGRNVLREGFWLVKSAFSCSHRCGGLLFQYVATSSLVKVFRGTANETLARSICAYIGISLGKCTIRPFPDGETFVKIEENVRGEDVFIVQPTSPPTNHNLMELFIMIDAVRRASAKRITAVLPFYGYARQDR